jgi:hypothetical protein
VRSRGRSVRSRGRSTGRADRQMTGPDEGPLSARLEDFKPAGAGQRRCRSGSMAVEPQPAERRLGTGTHPETSALAATRAGPGVGRVDLSAKRAVRAARRAMPEPEAATPGRAPLGTGTAPPAASGRTGRLDRPGPLRLPRVGRRRQAGAVSPATVWGSWITKNRRPRRSGQRCGRALNQRVDAPRAAPERAGRPRERLVVETLTVRRLVAHGLGPRQAARCRLAARLLPVLGRRSSPLRGR